MIRMTRPAHPGQFIRMEVIEPLDLSITQAAKVLGVTRSVLSALLDGRAALTGPATGTGVQCFHKCLR